MSQQLQQTMQATQHLSPAEQLELIKFMLAELAKQSKQWLDPIFQFLRELLWVYPQVDSSERILGLNAGTVWTSPDFDAPLPDEFWLGSEVGL